MTPRQHALAERLRKLAWGRTGEEAADLIDAAAIIERAPPPPESHGLRERNALVRKYFRQFCWDAASERAGITRFLMDVRTYRNGEFRHHREKIETPDSLDERRALLWRILVSGPPLPESIEGIRRILQ